MIIFRHNAQILLEKRPQTGIWGGLWCFPQCEETADIISVAQQYGFTEQQRQKLPAFRHTFSHFHLDCHPILIDITPSAILLNEKQQLWVAPDTNKDLGFAAPTVKLMKELTNN